MVSFFRLGENPEASVQGTRRCVCVTVSVNTSSGALAAVMFTYGELQILTSNLQHNYRNGASLSDPVKLEYSVSKDAESQSVSIRQSSRRVLRSWIF